uniref:Uncharacterized protein n=1 Tax=Trichogramma kaykai TaxID=54128 RepID=A0ABD2XN11_9HYME
MESREYTVRVKLEPKDTLSSTGEDYNFGSVDSCEVKNFEKFMFNETSVSHENEALPENALIRVLTHKHVRARKARDNSCARETTTTTATTTLTPRLMIKKRERERTRTRTTTVCATRKIWSFA